MSVVSDNLRRLLVRQGLTQGELAARAQVDVRTIKMILAGDSARPHPRTLHKLAGGLQVRTDELFHHDGDAARGDFDRATNPLVDEVLAEHAQLCGEWTAGDFAELYGHFGTGGALTSDGAREMIARIERKRATLERVALVMETDQGELLAEFVELLHRKVLVVAGDAMAADATL